MNKKLEGMECPPTGGGVQKELADAALMAWGTHYICDEPDSAITAMRAAVEVVIEGCAMFALTVAPEPGNNVGTRAQIRMRGRTHDALRALATSAQSGGLTK